MNRKIKKKNQIFEYYIPSFKKLMKTIYKQLIDDKPPYSIKKLKKKIKKFMKYDW